MLFHAGKGSSTGAQFRRYSVGAGTGSSQEIHKCPGRELVRVNPVIFPGATVGSGVGVSVGSGVGSGAGAGAGEGKDESVA